LPRGGSISGRATLLPSLTTTPSGVAPSPPHRRHPPAFAGAGSEARPRPWAGGALEGWPQTRCVPPPFEARPSGSHLSLYVRMQRKKRAVSAHAIRGLRRIGRRRASSMGDRS
jgi:hypothetical protein